MDHDHTIRNHNPFLKKHIRESSHIITQQLTLLLLPILTLVVLFTSPLVPTKNLLRTGNETFFGAPSIYASTMGYIIIAPCHALSSHQTWITCFLIGWTHGHGPLKFNDLGLTSKSHIYIYIYISFKTLRVSESSRVFLCWEIS